MGKDVLDTIVSIVSAIVGLAILSVLVSKNAQTSNVIQSAGSALASDIGAATAPVTGGGSSIGNLSSMLGSSGTWDTAGYPA